MRIDFGVIGGEDRDWDWGPAPAGQRGEWQPSGLRPSVPGVVVQGCVACAQGVVVSPTGDEYKVPAAHVELSPPCHSEPQAKNLGVRCI